VAFADIGIRISLMSTGPSGRGKPSTLYQQTGNDEFQPLLFRDRIMAAQARGPLMNQHAGKKASRCLRLQM
jgi:hypothetical protein